MAIAQGTIGFIKAFEIPAEKQHPNKFNKVNTHRLSFVLEEQEGVWFNAGEATKDHLDVKFQGNWVTLKKGDKVEFMYQQNGKYNNVKASAISLTEQAPEQQAPAQTQGGTQPAPKKSYRKTSSGDLVGHAIKCVCGIGIVPSASNFLDTAKQIYDVTAGLKVAYAAEHPELNDYEAGAPIGMAVEQLCRLGTPINELPEKVKEILDLQIPLKEYVDQGGHPASYNWKTITGAKAAPQTSDAPVADNEPPMDWDDDIPF